MEKMFIDVGMGVAKFLYSFYCVAAQKVWEKKPPEKILTQKNFRRPH
jgi:hypothetical protein